MNSELPLVSVVVPSRNEVRYIEKCINSILSSDYSSIEVIVVDGQSTDGTRELLIERFGKCSAVSVIDNFDRITPCAFNLGVEKSCGTYVQIVGARNILSADYITKMVKKLEENPQIGCVGGNYVHCSDTRQGEWISCAMESWFGVGTSNYRTRNESGFVDTVGVPMFRRRIFQEIGNFDENLIRNQDDDFSFRILKAGYKIFYLKDAEVKYFVRASFTRVFKQYFQYGYFKVFVNRKHRVLTTIRQVVPLFFVIFVALGSLLAIASSMFLIIYLLVLLLYFLLGFFAAGKFKKGFWSRLRVQQAIFVLHVGYGLGYLKGLIDVFFCRMRTPSKEMPLTT